MDSDNKDFVIPARPDVLLRLNSLVETGDPGIEAVAAVVKSDVSLYANTLAMINSPLFGLRRQITSINTAVRILGVKRIYTIVRIAALRSVLGDSDQMRTFWEEATLVAAIAGQLCHQFGFVSRDDAYTLGMLHNCGVPLMVRECPGFNHFYQDHSLLDPQEIMELEKDLFHINHYRVSSEIINSWSLPETIARAIDLQPWYSQILGDEDYNEEVCNLLALLLMAKELSLKFAVQWGLEEDYQPVLSMEPVLERLCLTHQDMERIQDTVFKSLRVDSMGVVAL